MPVHNFSAGPAALPALVRERLAALLASGADATPTLLELSHRGPEFQDVAERVDAGLRRLMGLGDAHEVLLMSGGAQLQFALLPMNLAGNGRAAYVTTGHWSAAALSQAKFVARADEVVTTATSGFTTLPETIVADDDASYLHVCGNETIHGVQFASPPQAAIPVIADLSSEILSRPYPFSSLGGFYASAQKNLGVAGVTLVVLKRELLERSPNMLAPILSYRAWAASDSMPNTPTSFAWLALLETIQWIEASGGLEAMASQNAEKAAKLYDCLDRHDCFETPVAPAARSQMNVVFRLADRSREATLLEAAAREALIGLEGHRSVGGLRVSLYNAVELASVDVLVGFLDDFARRVL